ncbi:MAG: RpiR family transcriptional regulator, partial [Mesorhizobium sp.]
GFTSLQLVFRERLRERNSSYDERLAALRAKAEEGAGHRAIFDGFVAAASTSLNDISGRLNEDHFEAAIALLAKAET